MADNEKIAWVRAWIESGEEIKAQLDSDGPRVIERLMAAGMSMREMGRRTGLSATYLSQVYNDKTRISPTSYLALLKLEE